MKILIGDAPADLFSNAVLKNLSKDIEDEYLLP
jgi:hypothetical protein